MPGAMEEYIAVNQLLVCGKCGDAEIDAMVSSIPRICPTKLEQIFLNFYRLPMYGVTATRQGDVIPFPTLANIMRTDRDAVPTDYTGLILSAFGKPKAIANGTERIIDGVPYLRTETLDAERYWESVAIQAFVRYCYCVEEKRADVCSLIMRVAYLYTFESSMELTPGFARKFAEECVSLGVHPQDLARTALYIPDLRTMLDSYNVCAFWDYPQHQYVRVVAPGKTKNTVCVAVLDLDQFIDLLESEKSNLPNMYVVDGYIKFHRRRSK